jgi:hypothetical protein
MILDRAAPAAGLAVTRLDELLEAFQVAIHAPPERMIEGLAALTPLDRLLKSGLFGT